MKPEPTASDQSLQKQTASSPQKIAQMLPSISLIKKVATESGVSSDKVEVALVGYQNKIRQLPKEEAAIKVTALVKQIAKKYGARQSIEKDVLNECVNLILEKFNLLGLHEIIEAYRLWTVGDITVKGGEMYGGVFHAGQIGRVLAAYTENRALIVGKYLTIKYEADKKRRKEAEQAAKKEQYEAEFVSYLANWSGQSWKDVPYHWYDTCLKRNMIQYAPGEKRQIWEKAQQLASQEITHEAEDEGNIFRKAALQHQFDCNVEDRAIVIARKLTVFRKVLDIKV